MMMIHHLPTALIDQVGAPQAPLVVAMHGIGSNERDLQGAYQGLASQAVLAFPRSPLPHPPGHAWYRLIRVGVPDPASFEQALATLGDFLAALRAQPGLGDRPLVLSGFSQGAIMALSYALRHPEQVAGVMAFSGYIPQPVLDAVPEGPAPTPGPRILLAHGHRDGLFPFERLDETAARLRARGHTPALAPHDGAHDIPPEAMRSAGTWLATTFGTPLEA
jgi:phospholipase/carboxylesterase